MFVGRESAELAKYAANAFLAVKISFINEIADLCEEVGASVQEVASAIGKDRRIGDKFLHPGPGYGGLLLPQGRLGADPHRARAQGAGVDRRAGAARQRRGARSRWRIASRRRAGGAVRGKVIVILGVTFKPNTDDMRDAPSLVIVPMLQERGALVRVVDPQGRRQAEPLLPGVTWCDSALEAAAGADVLVTVTEWNEFRALDLGAAKAKMRGDVLVDLRNVYAAEVAHAAGLRYSAIGRKAEDVDLAPAPRRLERLIAASAQHDPHASCRGRLFGNAASIAAPTCGEQRHEASSALARRPHRSPMGKDGLDRAEQPRQDDRGLQRCLPMAGARHDEVGAEAQHHRLQRRTQRAQNAGGERGPVHRRVEDRHLAAPRRRDRRSAR